jgi:chromosome segregation protein
VRLKNLTLFGFKSFADKVNIHFDTGITCIVGPNGCGKSNISDAFRWVLGEQSAKSIRGIKMPDIIFAGTTDRKPLNFAEVSLTLTDIQSSLPVEYEEMTITRRLHRNGESEYLLNGHSIRLKDLQALFLGSGIGHQAFSIFEQGKLDQVIHYSPLERRYIFEESAGILRFLQRKKDSLKRLEQVDLNLSRIQDIHREIAHHVQTLKEQAEKALLFKTQTEQIKNLEKRSYLSKWESLNKKTNELQTQQSNQILIVDAQKVEHSLVVSHLQDLKKTLQTHRIAINYNKEKIFSTKKEKELSQQALRSFQQRIQEANQRQYKLTQEKQILFKQQTDRKDLFLLLQKQQLQLDEKTNAVEMLSLEQKSRMQELQNQIFILRKDLAMHQQTHVRCIGENNQIQTNLKQTEIRVENQTFRQKELEHSLFQIKENEKQIEQIIREKKQQLLSFSHLIDNHKLHLQKFEEDFKKVTEHEENQKREIEKRRRKYIENEVRYKALMRMHEEHEGFSSGSQKLLQESQNPKSSLYQKVIPLYEYILPQPIVAEMLSSILHPYAQTLVVQTQTDCQLVLDFAKIHQLQEYSLICLDWIHSEHKTPSALEEHFLLKYLPFHHIANHFLSDIELNTSLSQCWNFFKEKTSLKALWSEEFFFDFHRVLFKWKPQENQIFMRASEIKLLENELMHEKTSLTNLEQALQQLQLEKSFIQKDRIQLDKILRRDEMKLVEINFGLQQTLREQEKNFSLKCKQEPEIKIEQQKLAEYILLRDQLSQQLQVSQKILLETLTQKVLCEEELKKQENILYLKKQEQEEKNILHQKLFKEKQQLVYQKQLLDSQAEEYQRQIKRIEEEQKELQFTQTSIELQIKELQQFICQIDNQLQEILTSADDLKKKDEQFVRELQKKEQQEVTQQEAIRAIEQELVQLDIKIQHSIEALRNIEIDLLDRYQLTAIELQNTFLPPTLSLEYMEKQIRKLRQSLQEIGNVNLTAIEELEKHQVREGFLIQQLKDMQASKEDLLAMIQQLDKESRSMFRETFEMIRTNFKKNFEILFNGGEADLQFINSTDILEAGIEISAKPPGKHMRSISLLSGGEKCLVAVALLFAIFEVKPAPFCILDEIDAPLDDTNVERFLSVVKHFTNSCQFIIITHNKRTMALGDVLFGVSMEKKGVSTLLSLQFAQKTANVSLI